MFSPALYIKKENPSHGEEVCCLSQEEGGVAGGGVGWLNGLSVWREISHHLNRSLDYLHVIFFAFDKKKTVDDFLQAASRMHRDGAM